MNRWIALDLLYTLGLTPFLALCQWKFSNTQSPLVVKGYFDSRLPKRNVSLKKSRYFKTREFWYSRAIKIDFSGPTPSKAHPPLEELLFFPGIKAPGLHCPVVVHKTTSGFSDETLRLGSPESKHPPNGGVILSRGSSRGSQNTALMAVHIVLAIQSCFILADDRNVPNLARAKTKYCFFSISKFPVFTVQSSCTRLPFASWHKLRHAK